MNKVRLFVVLFAVVALTSTIVPIDREKADGGIAFATVIVKLVKFSSLYKGKDNVVNLSVIGDDSISKALLSIDGEKIQGLIIKVNSEPTKLAESGAIYISPFNKMEIGNLKRILANPNFLTFTSSRQILKSGCLVHIYLKRTKIKFFINENLLTSNVSLPSSVLRLAVNAESLKKKIEAHKNVFK